LRCIGMTWVAENVILELQPLISSLIDEGIASMAL
jgi:hypothetical protein